MLLVTGGAGFIGSNVVASLNEAGRTDIVVNDTLGSDGKWRNLAEAPACRFRFPGRTVRLARRTASSTPSSISAPFRRRRRTMATGDREQFSPVAAASGLVHTRPHALHLRILGRDLWGRRAGFVDDNSLDALKRLRPMNLYGWSKHLFDLALARPPRQTPAAAAAMGRIEVLQCLRPERIPQGRHDERALQGVRRGQGRQAGAPVQVAPRRHCRRRSAARFHLCG